MGLGGCPFAPGVKGNVASENLVYMFHNAGIHTGVDLLKLIQTGVWISEQLSKTNGSRAGTSLALKSKNLSKVKIKPSKDPSSEWDFAKEIERLQLHRLGINLKITLNRPKSGNALTASMISDLTSVVKAVGEDPQTSRIIITENGRVDHRSSVSALDWFI
ncbi:uncharacterized protein N7529_003450 [Penicillium soppii]|uniref:uncharacterized protein n=1 Tax=Penicillium soppii TaxID=69789 RepID=UPI002546D870|nr:uncharacterized protein N7529_003450 [Penicillium soppii]KAJ5871097.1 hypothetical protein N7529_003450 [Penicillium soppii]